MKIWTSFGLRSRILFTMGALVLITALGGIVMIWYTYRMEDLLTGVVQNNVASLQAAKGLETALLNQRGYVSYYLLENNPDWLKELGRYRQEFDERMREARRVDRVESCVKLLDQIDAQYRGYIDAKDKVITLYMAGKRDEGAKLHQDVRKQFFDLLRLCAQYNEIHSRELTLASEASRSQARGLRAIAAVAISTAGILGGILAFILIAQILTPIRRLAIQTGGEDKSNPSDEVAALKSGVRGLIADVDHTHMELERSRERLLQSERMALVGKLAAEVAHSIRNPMTSIKMRLFSLARSLGPSPAAREDFEVISEEMRHLDNIVRNFLEFSRPPKLKLQQVNVSDVVEMALQLLEKRLERHGVLIERERRNSLPGIEADPELLKEVMVNLIVNACDAMGEGGTITITEEDGVAERIGRAVLVQLTDTGPGIPDTIRDKIFQPFFTTKEEGTGLGLSIAARIVEEHGGRLECRSGQKMGTTFIIALPVKEEPI